MEVWWIFISEAEASSDLIHVRFKTDHNAVRLCDSSTNTDAGRLFFCQQDHEMQWVNYWVWSEMLF